MKNLEKNPEFLKKKYDLHKAPETEKAAERTEARTGEKVPQNPADRIQNYLNRLERLVLDSKKEQSQKRMPGGHGDIDRPRALSLLREKLMNKYVRPQKDRMAQAAANVEERAARELGIEAQYGEEQLEQRGDIAVKDLERSLDQWIDYLSDPKEPYPTWFRYYAFRNVLEIGDYDKDKGDFPKRSAGQVRLFPDIDRGALAYVEEMIEAAKDPAMLDHLQKAQREAANRNIPENQLITQEKAEAFSKLSFARQYAEGIKEAGEITPELRAETRGEWIKYSQNSDPTPLWSSLQRKGTAWCTKGFATAATQLKGGDFYVYYTLDKQGNPTIPRIAIRMEGDRIFETRGVADNQQNLEGNMTQIAEEKMNELPGKEKYQKISADMKMMTDIYKKSFQINKQAGLSAEASAKAEEKTYLNPELTKDELIFLYEINSKIEGFGYQRDPRIEEVRKQRDSQADASIVFECESSQIAHNPKEINENTKAYIGPLFKGVFQLDLEHIGTSFPEGMIRKMEAEIGGKNKKELVKELEKNKINVSGYASDMLNSKDFTISEIKEHLDLIRLTVKDLGFPSGATTEKIYQRAEELGLELCPAETGPNLRLEYINQPLNEWIYMAMKQIADSNGDPNVFILEHDNVGLWLRAYWAGPGGGWHPDGGFVFRVRKQV